MVVVEDYLVELVVTSVDQSVGNLKAGVVVVVGQAALEEDLAVVYREELAVDLVRHLD